MLPILNSRMTIAVEDLQFMHALLHKLRSYMFRGHGLFGHTEQRCCNGGSLMV